jgi:hypothetical protein
MFSVLGGIKIDDVVPHKKTSQNFVTKVKFTSNGLYSSYVFDA